MKNNLCILGGLLLLISPLSAREIQVTVNTGHSFIFDVDETESFIEVEERIKEIVQELPGGDDFVLEGSLISLMDQAQHRETIREFPLKPDQCSTSVADSGGYIGHPRSYLNPIKQEERDDITWIVTTLATRSIGYIFSNRSDFQKTGKRVDHVHPFRFLEVIFTSEELKANIRNIRTRGWKIWDQFSGGIKKSLETESNLNNLNAYIDPFVKSLNIEDPNVCESVRKTVTESVATKNWDAIIDVLITQVPRKGVQDRYRD